MSLPSDLSSAVERRVPRQARAERTVSTLLDAAAEVIAENGYDATTLTAVAARAGASIGSLYQYFRDKPAVARALAQRYGAELADAWAPLIAEAKSLPLKRLVDRMFHIVLKFHADHPAFLALTTTSVDYRHANADRSRLRSHVTAVLRAHQPRLNPSDAARVAEVTVQIFKGMNQAFDRQTDSQRQAMTAEFKLVLLGYLGKRLRAERPAP